MDANCLRCRQLLSAAMDGEATAREIAFIQQHMATCPDCREAQAAYTNLRSRFQTLSQPLPPPQLRMAVMTQVRGGRAVPGRRPVVGLRPLLNVGQRLTVIAVAAVILVLGGLIIWGVLRTPPFEVVDQQADLTSQKVVVTFSQPVDAAYIMAHPDLIEVKDTQGQSIPLTQDDIKVNNEGKTVEISLPPGALKPNEQKVDLEIKPDVKASDGKMVKNPGPKQAVVVPARPTPTPKPPTRSPKPVQPTVAPTDLPVTPSPAQTTPPAVTTAPDQGQPTVAPPPAALPTAVATPTKKPTTAPPTTMPISTTVAPTTAPDTTVPVSTTVAPTTAPDTTVPVTVTVVPTTTVAPTTAPVTTTVVPSPTLRSDACQVNLRRGFGKLYNERADVAPKIGCPLVEEAQAGLTYQPFQHGFMLWHKQSGMIYIFYSATGQGSWTKLADPGAGELPPPNTPAPSATAVPTITPTPTVVSSCTFTPRRGFGNIWATRPGVRNALGCPLIVEAGTDLGAYQPFERGIMFFNPLPSGGARIYVVYNDGTFIDVLNTFEG